MATDLTLAVLHHLLAFSLMAVLATEAAFVRPEMNGQHIRRLVVMDRGYGAIAGSLLVIGFLRVFYGLKGAEFYLDNWIFWAKIGAFAAVGLLSIGPTAKFIAWHRTLQREPSFTPARAEIDQVRGFLRAQAVVVMLIPILAATMARGYGY